MQHERGYKRKKNEPISKKELIPSVLARVVPEKPVRWCRAGKVHKATQKALQVAKWKTFTTRILTNCFSFSCFIYYPSNETFKSWCIWFFFFYPRQRGLAVSWGALFGCNQTQFLSTDETSRRPRLTCADRDGAHKLLPPAAAPHHQGQVCLLDQLVHRALRKGRRNDRKSVTRSTRNKRGNKGKNTAMLWEWKLFTQVRTRVLVPLLIWDRGHWSAEIGRN